MKKINIGFTPKQKSEVIFEYLKDNDIDSIVYFSNAKPLQIDFQNTEYRTWEDAIMYKYFYPLLEKINNKTLLIFDNMMKTRKRNDLTYNCCHHYGNQTEHILVFEWFPMIEEPEDFMILLDFAYPNKYKGQPYNPEYLKYADIKRQMVELESVPVEVSEEEKNAYEEEKEMLFENIGNKDPNTIPRTLHIWCGTHCKKKAVKEIDGWMISRNKRFIGDNISTWAEKISFCHYIIDFPLADRKSVV